jgi:hypothetical protein
MFPLDSIQRHYKNPCIVSTGSVGCDTLVYVVHCQGSISHLEQTELISIAEWTSIFTQSTIKDHPIINHTDINVKVD